MIMHDHCWGWEEPSLLTMTTPFVGSSGTCHRKQHEGTTLTPFLSLTLAPCASLSHAPELLPRTLSHVTLSRCMVQDRSTEPSRSPPRADTPQAAVSWSTTRCVISSSGVGDIKDIAEQDLQDVGATLSFFVPAS